jgi:hypothetical protein
MKRPTAQAQKRKAPSPTGLSLRIFAAACCDATSVSKPLAALAALLLARLLLPAVLAALTRILGLLTGLLLPALLTALVRVVHALLPISHNLRSLLAAPSERKRFAARACSWNPLRPVHISLKTFRIKGSKPAFRSLDRGDAFWRAGRALFARRAAATFTPLHALA